MADWKRVVERRLAPLRLNRSSEAALVDEIGEHLEDLYVELRTSGASADAAYRETIAELDDMYPLRASIDRSQMMTDTVVGRRSTISGTTSSTRAAPCAPTRSSRCS
jgi:hypothetical protein